MNKLVFTFLGIVISIQFCNAQDNIGSGNCLDFDGINDYVDCTDINSSTFDDINTALTIEAWVNTTTTSGYRSIVTKYNTTSGFNNWSFIFQMRSGGQLEFAAYRPGGANFVRWTSDAPALSINAWTHVALTMSLSSVQGNLYVNGEATSCTQVNVGTIPVVFSDSNTPVEIGSIIGASGRTDYWSGKIDEVRIWNTVRTNAEIKDNMTKKLVGNEPGLKAYWNMNEGSGNVVNDLTTNANNGTRQ